MSREHKSMCTASRLTDSMLSTTSPAIVLLAKGLTHALGGPGGTTSQARVIDAGASSFKLVLDDWPCLKLHIINLGHKALGVGAGDWVGPSRSLLPGPPVYHLKQAAIWVAQADIWCRSASRRKRQNNRKASRATSSIDASCHTLSFPLCVSEG